jgi:hypothetical protein
MTEHINFESWKAAGIAAGYAGPYRIQGHNQWQFTFRGEPIAVWSEARGRIGNVTRKP